MSLFLEKFSAKKLLNLLSVVFQKKVGVSKVWGTPFLLFVDTTNICNLRCPLCPTGLNLPGYERGVMKFDTFKKVIDEIGGCLFSVGLYDWGEPFLNKDIFKMIKYANKKKVITFLSTNANLLDEAKIKKIVESQLDQIVISLDGVDEKSYAKYRVKGDYSRVINNVRALVELKKKMGSNKPFIEWQFLVMKHNEKDIGAAKEMSRKLGVDSIHFRPINLCDTPFQGTYDKNLAVEWLPTNANYKFEYDRPPLNKTTCLWLWYSIFVNWKGDIYPCCETFEERHKFGSIYKDSIRDIWNNDYYLDARSLFLGRTPTKKTICNSCQAFKKRGL